MISPAQLDTLMHRAWPGLQNIPVDGWIARIAGGITARANSVLPVEAPRDLHAALQDVEGLYRQRGIPPTFQISPAAQPPSLDALLAGRGYELRSPTLIWTATTASVLERLPSAKLEITIRDQPDRAWMDCWWSVDGRGGGKAREIARRILGSTPAVYGAVQDSESVAAVGRLALVDGWGGIYCMAVREDVRRRGYGRAILRALLEEASKRNIGSVWLQVVETNIAARALYAEAGFAAASKYHYRTRAL